MSTQLAVHKEFLGRVDVKAKLEELLGKRAAQFGTSLMQVINGNAALQKADPKSVFNAAVTAALLDLPINNNLGFAYIVPYKDQAQFQLGYKGFIQLAQRSGQFKRISAAPIYEGQIAENDPLKGFKFDFTRGGSQVIIGYAAYFELINGYEATLYMSVEEIRGHGKKYSQTFKKGFGVWEDNFEAMAIKTVLKLLLAKYAPLSIEMQRAVVADQAVVNDVDTQDVTYIDNSPEAVNKEQERVEALIRDAQTLADLDKLREDAGKYSEETWTLFQQRGEDLKNKTA